MLNLEHLRLMSLKGSATITNVYYTADASSSTYRTTNTYVIEGKQNKKDFKINAKNCQEDSVWNLRIHLFRTIGMSGI